MKKTFLKLVLAGLFISTVNISCSSSSTTTNSSEVAKANQLDLLGKWDLVFLDNKSGQSLKMDYPQGLPYVNFTAVDHISASDGCNTFHGPVKVEKDQFVFGNLASTMMACENVKDFNFSSKFNGNVQYKLEGNDLIILKDKKEVMKLNRALSVDGTWVLEEFIGKDRSMKTLQQRFPLKVPTITFANGNVSGSNGCNNIAGPFTIDGNTIKMGNLISTRMACEGVDGSFDERFSKVNSYDLNNNKLTLYVDGVKTMVFGNLKQPR